MAIESTGGVNLQVLKIAVEDDLDGAFAVEVPTSATLSHAVSPGGRFEVHALADSQAHAFEPTANLVVTARDPNGGTVQSKVALRCEPYRIEGPDAAQFTVSVTGVTTLDARTMVPGDADALAVTFTPDPARRSEQRAELVFVGMPETRSTVTCASHGSASWTPGRTSPAAHRPVESHRGVASGR